MTQDSRPRVGDIYLVPMAVIDVDGDTGSFYCQGPGGGMYLMKTSTLHASQRIGRKTIEVGEKVKSDHNNSLVGEVLAVVDSVAWVKYSEGDYASLLLSALTPVPSDEAGGA